MRNVAKALHLVFRNKYYVLLATVFTFLVFTFIVWLPNISLIVQIAGSDSIAWLDKLNFLGSLYGSIATNFTVVSATYSILIAVLFGISVSLFLYYIRQQHGIVSSSATATSIGGLVSGFFGIGCAACGTFILTSTLTLFGATSILAFLPFGGEEFGFLGVGLLGYSIYKTAQLICKPNVC